MARRIAKELANAKQCGVYELELSRFWPNTANARESEIALLAELPGLRLRYCKEGFCAIFDEGPVSLEEFGVRSVTKRGDCYNHNGLRRDNIEEVISAFSEFVIGGLRTGRPAEKNLNKLIRSRDSHCDR